MGIVTDEVIRVRVYCSSTEQVSINTIYFKCVSHLGAGASYLQAATDFDGVLSPFMRAVLASPATYNGVGVQSMTASPIFDEALSGAGAGVGLAGDVGLPRQTAGLVRCKTGLAGRKNRGRAYLPFPAADDNVVNGFPTAAYRTRANAVGATFYSPINFGAGANTSGMIPVLYHRARVTPGPIPASWTPIISHDAALLWATQRRRSSFGAANTSPL